MFDLAFSPADSSLLASASDDDSVKVWQLGREGSEEPAQHSQIACYRGHDDSVLRVSWAPDGQLLASGEPPP